MAATDIERGLSTAEVEERIAAGKINRNMELKTKSVKELIIENLCTLFNLINVILAFLVILTGSFKNLTFLFVVFLNTAIGVIQSMRSKKMVDKLTLLTSKKAIAVRDGAEVELDLDQIVLVDNDFASMPAVVAEGRRSINNLQRSASLFLTKTLFSMGLAALCIALPPYPFEPIQMTLINFFCIGAPGFVLGLEPNNARVKGAFLTNVLKRALPASIAVILAAALDIFVARVFGFSQLTLSTMCLLTSCAASVSLIWRISQPLTPLRVVLFVFVVAGILVGVIGFPELLSIANLSMGQMVILAVIVVFTCSVFFKLATMMDSLKPRRRHAATGFGRGVRVHLGRGGGKVSSTGSTAERFAKRVAADMAQRREDRTAREAEARALEGVAQVQPKKKKPTGAKRSRVTKSAQGIKVSMPSKKKK